MPAWLINRFPVLLFSLALTELFIIAPSQLRDQLASQGPSPVILLVMLVTFNCLLALAHLSFLAARGQFQPITDSVAVSLPLIAACLSLVRVSPDAWIPSLVAAITGTLIIEIASRRLVPHAGLALVWLMGTVGALYLGALILTITFPVSFPRVIGSVCIVFFGLGALTVGIAGLLLIPLRARNIVLGIFMLCLVFDPIQHAARRIPPGEGTSEFFRERFSAWILSRADLNAYKDAKRPYPVIITSAAGGGITAAAHAYAVLETLQKLCPNFSQHVLASVGVSGGSLGDALFASTVSDAAQRTDVVACQRIDGQINLDPVLADHLAPVLAAFLFADVPNALLPASPVPTDRAIALEKSIEQSGTGTDSYFARPIEDSWQPTGATPAQIFVATQVQTGERYILTPLSAEYGEYHPGTDATVSMSTAIGISARFPWLTPTARIPFASDVLLADGGYFENSGADTATELAGVVRGLETPMPCGGDLPADCNVLYFPDKSGQRCQLRVDTYFDQDVEWGCDVHIHISYVAIADFTERWGTPFTTPDPPQSFWLDPLTTMLNTRTARGQLALGNAIGSFCLSDCVEGNELDSGMHTNLIATSALDLPLGWTLSRASLNKILETTIAVDRCAELRHQLDPTYEVPNFPSFKQEDPAAILDANACGLATVAGLFNLTDPAFRSYYGIQGVPYL